MRLNFAQNLKKQIKKILSLDRRTKSPFYNLKTILVFAINVMYKKIAESAAQLPNCILLHVYSHRSVARAQNKNFI